MASSKNRGKDVSRNGLLNSVNINFTKKLHIISQSMTLILFFKFCVWVSQIYSEYKS